MSNQKPSRPHALAIPILAAFALCMMSLLGEGYAQAGTSSEAVNPFNQFSTAEGGVNLFSGDAYLPHKLYILGGRNGMDVDLELSYSSNIFLNVVARNDKAPTGWLGLGWQLKLGGSVTVDHHNTMTLADDEYVYSSPEGITQRIFQSEGKYYLETDPYWKVEPELEGTNRIKGWKFTDPTGKIFRYGDFANHNSGTRNATRYVFSWDGSGNNDRSYVGDGFGGTPELYPFQWDLAEIEDLAGNKIKYQYTQELSQIAYKQWANSPSYTKASYLLRIENPDGESIEFDTEEKDPGEIYDPKAFGPEPDAFMEFFETKRLRKIRVKNRSGSLVREFEFCYRLINDDAEMLKVGANYMKSLLNKVFERDGVGTELGTVSLEYYDDAAKRVLAVPGSEEQTPPTYNFGALKSFQGKTCGKTTFEYKRQDNGADRGGSFKGGTNFGSDVNVQGGILENGNEYMVVWDKYTENIWIYNWESGQWKVKHVLGGQKVLESGTRLGLAQSKINKVVTGPKFFAVLKGSKLSIFNWNGQDWMKSNLYDTDESYYYPDMVAFAVVNNMLVSGQLDGCTGGIGDCIQIRIRIWAWHWIGGEWVKKEVASFDPEGPFGTDFSQWTVWFSKVFAARGIQVAGNHLMLETREDWSPAFGNDHAVYLYFFNGSEWVRTKEMHDLDRQTTHRLGRNTFVQVSEAGLVVVNHYASAWNWDGKDWVRTMNESKLDGPETVTTDDDATTADIQAEGDGYFVARYNDKDHLRIYQWNGEAWKARLSTDIVNSNFDPFYEAYWRGYSGNDYFVATYPRVKWTFLPIPTCLKCRWFSCRLGCFVDIPVWKEIDQDAKFRAYNLLDKEWLKTDWGTQNYDNTGKKFTLGQDFFVSKDSPHRTYVWNGASWQPEKQPYPLGDKVDVIAPNVFVDKSSGVVTRRKFQNSTVNKIFSFVVSRKIVEDPITGAKHTFTYEYELAGSMYDTQNGTAKFNKVSVSIPNHGKEVSYFFNDYEDPSLYPTEASKANNQKTINAEFEKLDGLAYKKESFNILGKKVSEKTFSYEVYRGEDKKWPGKTYHVRNTGERSVLDGVVSVTDIKVFDGNGLPKRVTETNSDGRKRITETRFAFEEAAYESSMGPGLNGKNMLTAVAATTIYENSVAAANVRSASAVTWVSGLGSGTARFPNQSYVWNRPPSSTNAFQEFVFSNPGSNTANNWELVRTISKYDAGGMPVEYEDASGKANAEIYGRSRQVNVATCLNARQGQCAVFTGDYDDGENASYFDFLGGWQKGGSALSATLGHYGAASVQVRANQQGPTKTLTPGNSRDYAFSAWVYPVVVNASSPVVLKVLVNGTPVLPAESVFGNLQPGTTAGWQKVERRIPKALLGSGQVTISVSSQGGSDFHLDDIRFHPMDALITTQFYHPKLLLPVCTVDPGRRAEYLEYDEAGRMVKTYLENSVGAKVKTVEVDFSNIKGCSMGAPWTGLLSKVSFSEGNVDFNPSTLVYPGIAVANTVEKLVLNLEPQNPEEPIATSINQANYQSDCCNTSRKMVVPLNPGLNSIRIKVGNAVNPYEFQVTRLENCWSYQGSPVSGARSGSAPALGFDGNQAYAAYKDEGTGKLYVMKNQAGVWTAVGGAISVGEASDAVLKVHQNIPYIAYIDMQTVAVGTPPNQIMRDIPRVVVKRWISGAWNPVGGTGATVDGIASKGASSQLSFDIGTETQAGSFWVAFVGDPTAEEGLPENQALKGNRVYVRKLVGSTWTPIGENLPESADPLVPVAGDGIPDGIVSEYPAVSVSLAVSPTGTPYVAYAGSQRVATGDATPENTVTPRLVIIKKLRTSVNQNGATMPIWGDVKDELAGGEVFQAGGDVVSAANPKRVKLAFSGARLFLAYDHALLNPIQGQTGVFEESDENVLVVREFDAGAVGTDGSHWIPVPSTGSESGNRVLAVDPLGDYQFFVQGGVPKIVFTNQHGDYRVTAIEFHGGTEQKWKSIGIPAFAQGATTSQESGLAIGTGQDGTPIVTFRGGEDIGPDRKGRINALRYNVGCKDPTLAQIELKKPDQSEVELDIAFKQYYTYYRAAVESGVTQLQIRPTPNTCADLGKISLRAGGATLSSWTNPGNCNTPPTFAVNLVEGLNIFEVVGQDNAQQNSIRYRYLIYKKPSPVPASLEVEIRPQVRINPAFSIANVGPYTTSSVPHEQSTVLFVARFPSNTTVFVNGIAAGSGQEIPVDLQVGSNTITMVAEVSGGPEKSYEFRVQRLPKQGGDTTFNQLLLFKHPVQEIVYYPVSRSANYHDLSVSSDLSAIRVVKVGGTGCDTYVNGTLITGGVLVVPLPGQLTNLFIQKSCSGVAVENHLVVVRKVATPSQVLIVGHREGTEPEGFYDFRDITEAFNTTYSMLQSTPAGEAPASVGFYVVADWGSDMIVEVPPIEFPPFEKNGAEIPLEIFGVIKGSDAYQDLLDAFNGHAANP